MSETIRILYVDDNPLDRELVRDALTKEQAGFELIEVASRAEFESALATGTFDIVLSDFNILGFEGLQVVDAVREIDTHMPVVIVTGSGSEEIAVEAMKRGAIDYVIKDNKHIRGLPMIIQAVLDRKQADVERQRAEQERRESQELYRAIFDGVQDAILVESTEGKILAVNDRACEMYGYDRTEFLSKTVADLVPVSAAVLKMGDEGPNFSSTPIETVNLRANGELFPIEISGRLQTINGETVMMMIVRDITERKRAEYEIQHRSSELSMLYELARSLSDSNDVDTILQIITRYAVEITQVTFARIILIENDEFVARVAYPPRVLDSDLPVGTRRPVTVCPFYRRVLEQIDPVIVRADNQELDEDECQALFLGIAQTLCLVPLHVGDFPMGLLILGEVQNLEHEPFTLENIRLARNIGDQAASSLRRATLFKQTEQRLQKLAALRAVDLAINSNLNLHMTLDVLLAHVVEQLGVDAAEILRFNPYLNTLEYAVGRGFRGSSLTRLRLRLGEGYAGEAALEQRLISVPNLKEVEFPLIRVDLTATEDFVAYYVAPLIAKGKIKGVLEVFHRESLNPDSEWLDFLEALAEQAAIAIDNADLFNNLQRSNIELSLAYDATIEGWSRALDLRDKETEGHTLRVTEMTLRLAKSIGLGEQELVYFRWGALLHDIGKMGVPDAILFNPNPLTDEEWKIMKKHPIFGYEMLAPIQYLQPAIDIPYCHHEKWDGTGYPRGLRGEQIPMAARIFSVVDVWDALTSDRPYRKALGKDEAMAYIIDQVGKYFDPQVTEKFFQLVGNF